MDYIRGKFVEIEDSRHSCYITHNLSDILIIVMCAVMCGLDGLAELTVFAEKRAGFFKSKFGIMEVPSKPTFSRILNMLDGDRVAEVIIEIMVERTKFVKHIANILAVDGKTIRSTVKSGKPNSALQILTAYLTGSSAVLCQKAIHEKTNEIPVFQEMLDIIDIRGKIITADALHCQTKTCEKIIGGGGDYVFGLKKNHKIFYDEMCLFFESENCKSSLETFTTAAEKNGGRIEKRICRKMTDILWFEDKDKWVGLKTVFSVQRITSKKGVATVETTYYITSLDTTAEELLKITREHWKIESMHWLLDVVFSEDECKIISENGQKTLNILRKLALLVHKHFLSGQPKKCSIKANLLNCLLDEELLYQVLESL
jgi:predicted transposase YbfD/YdcC